MQSFELSHGIEDDLYIESHDEDDDFHDIEFDEDDFE